MKELKSLTVDELCEAIVYSGDWQNDYSAELCRRAGMFEKYIHNQMDTVRAAARYHGRIII